MSLHYPNRDSLTTLVLIWVSDIIKIKYITSQYAHADISKGGE